MRRSDNDDGIQTRRTFLRVRLTLLATTVAALLAAAFAPQPAKAALIVFGLVVGSAWIVGVFISNRLRGHDIRKAIDGDR